MKFSVLMCTYHGESSAFLEECFQSIYVQTLPHDELVLVADGDLGESMYETIDRWSERLNIKFDHYYGDGQLGGALNKGLSNCSNELVLRMDSDDICDNKRFEIQVSKLSAETDILSMHVAEFEGNKLNLKGVREVPENVEAKHIFSRNPINHMAVGFKKTKILELGGYIPLVGFEDWYLWLRAFKKGYVIKNLKTIGVYARVSNGFWDRRSGFAYALRECRALTIFWREKLLPTRYYCLALIIRIPARLLNSQLGYAIFSKFYRK